MGRIQSRLRFGQQQRYPVQRRQQARRRFIQLCTGWCNRTRRTSNQPSNFEQQIPRRASNPPRNYFLRLQNTLRRVFRPVRAQSGASPASSARSLRSRISQRPRRSRGFLQSLGDCVRRNREESSSGQELSSFRPEREQSSKISGEVEALLSGEPSSRKGSDGSRSSRELSSATSLRSGKGDSQIINKTDMLINKSKEDIRIKDRSEASGSSSKEPIVFAMGDFRKSFHKEREHQKKTNIKRPIIFKSNIRKSKCNSESNLSETDRAKDDEIERQYFESKKHVCDPLDVVIHNKSKKLKFGTTSDGKTVITDPLNPEHQKMILLEEKLQWGIKKDDKKQTEKMPKSKSFESLKKIHSDTDILRRYNVDFSWKRMWRNTLRTPRRRIHLMWLKHRAGRSRNPNQPWHIEPMAEFHRSEPSYREVAIPKSLSENCLLKKQEQEKIMTRAATFDAGIEKLNKYFMYYYPYLMQTKTFGYSTTSAFKDVVIASWADNIIKKFEAPQKTTTQVEVHEPPSSGSTTQNLSMPSTSKGDSYMLSPPSTSKDSLNEPSTSKHSIYEPSSSSISRPGSSKAEHSEYSKFVLDSPITEIDEEVYSDSEEDSLSTSV